MPDDERLFHIWGRLSSINVRKAVWAAQEVGAAIQRTDAGGHFGLVQTPEFLRMNPNAMVPVLQDGPVTLWESNVIVRYLADQYPEAGLMPKGTVARFEAEQWMDWQQTTLNPAGRDAFVQLFRVPEAERDMARVQASVSATDPLMALLEQRLAQQPFIVGEHFSMADIPIACEVHRWFGLPLARPAWPHVERWFAQLQTRPGSKGILDMALS